MGRLSQLGGAVLGVAVALNAGEALSQDKSDKELPKKGYVPTDVSVLNQYRYAMLDSVGVFDDGGTKERMAHAIKTDQLVLRSGDQVSIYWKMKPLGIDPVSGNPVFEYVQKNIQRECITADNYVDTFQTYDSGQQVMVLDRDDQFDHVPCPDPVERPKPIVPTIQTSEEVPVEGNFANLEMPLIEAGVFLVPIKVGMEEKDLTPDLDVPTNFVRRSSKGVSVYKRYILDEYAPGTGRLTVRPVDDEDKNECAATITYKDKFKREDQVYYVLPELGTMEFTRTICKEMAPVVSKTTKSWALPVRAGLGLGVDMEETSEYNLGYAPNLHLSAQMHPWDIPLAFGVSGDFVFTGEGSGVEGVDVLAGYQHGPIGAYVTLGDSFEPRERYRQTTLNGALSYGVLVAGDIYKFELIDQALALNCHASAQKHLYGGGGQFNLNVAAGCEVAWDTVVSGEGKEKAVAVEAQSEGPHLEIKTKPYSYELPTFEETEDAGKKAELVRLSEEMNKRAMDNKWDAVESMYDSAMRLGIPLSYRDHKNGAEAARAAGNMQECYERILLAQTVAIGDLDKKQMTDWIADIEANYSRVAIVIGVKGEVTLEVSQMPFDPAQRKAIAFAQAGVVDGSFEGLIPLILNLDGTQGTYTLNGQIIKVSDLRPLSSKITTEIRLER